MPAPVIPDEGKTCFMGILLNQIKSGGSSGKVFLYTNNFTPTTSTVLADLTPAAAGGMTEQATPAATDSGVFPAGVDNWIFSPITFTATGAGLPETYYGYGVKAVDPITAASLLLWAQKFDVPQLIIAAGQTVPFVLSLAGTQG